MWRCREKWARRLPLFWHLWRLTSWRHWWLCQWRGQQAKNKFFSLRKHVVGLEHLNSSILVINGNRYLLNFSVCSLLRKSFFFSLKRKFFFSPLRKWHLDYLSSWVRQKVSTEYNSWEEKCIFKFSTKGSFLQNGGVFPTPKHFLGSPVNECFWTFIQMVKDAPYNDDEVGTVKEEASNEFWPFIIELFATNINHLLPKAHPHIAIKKLNSKETLFILAIKKFVMKVGCCCNWHLPKMVVTSLVTFTSSTFSDPSKYANINKPPNLDPDRKYIPSMGYKVLLVGFVPKKTWDACVLNGVANWTEEKEPWKLALQSTLLREGGGLQNISSSMSLE